MIKRMGNASVCVTRKIELLYTCEALRIKKLEKIYTFFVLGYCIDARDVVYYI